MRSFPAADAVPAQEMSRMLSEHVDAEVTVKLGGMLIDVFQVAYDPGRDKFILHLHPDDVDEVLRRQSCRAPTLDRAAECAVGKEELMKTMLADTSAVRGWQRAVRCDNSGPNCVEVAPYGNGVAVRSSREQAGPALLFDRDEWAAFTGAVRCGEFDNLAG